MLGNDTAIQPITNPTNSIYVETIDHTTYEVISKHIGDIPFVDLIKKMIKRDIERFE